MATLAMGVHSVFLAPVPEAQLPVFRSGHLLIDVLRMETGQVIG
jgi:hypothetical protein